MLSSNFSPNYGGSSNDPTEIEDINREENDGDETKSTNKQLMSPLSANTSAQLAQYSNLDIEHIDKAIKSPPMSPTQLISPRQPRQVFKDGHDLLGGSTNPATKIPLY